MRQRLFVLLLLLMLVMMLGVMIILIVTGTFSVGKSESEGIVSSELNHISNDIDLKYSLWTAESLQMSKTVASEIETKLGAMGIAVSDLANHPEVLDTILDSEFESCSFYLQRSDCSGVYLILDATVNPSAENASYAKAGLYLEDTDPDSVSTDMESYYLLHGFADIAASHGIALHPQWEMEFNIEDASYYAPVMENARSGSYEKTKLYYWSEPMYMTGVSEQVMLCSVPLIASDGTVFGVCGCEIDMQKFKDLFSPHTDRYAHIFTVFSKDAPVAISLDKSFVCGGYTPVGKEILEIGKKKNSLYEYTEKDGTVYFGYQTDINLYPEGSPYSNAQWQVSVLVRKDDVMRSSVSLTRNVILLLSVLLAATDLLAQQISKRYITPILTGLNAIKTNEYGDEKTKVPEIDELIAYLSEHKSEIAEKTETMLSAMIDEFLARTQTLTPAERAVFNLYLQDYTAQETAQELFLSINTIKTHTKRIYNKLNIGSREELMLYVEMLKEAGRDIAQE